MAAIDDGAVWLLDVHVGGEVLAYATVDATVDGVEYVSGLGDLEVAVGADSVDVVVTDPTVDWPTLAAVLDGGPCVLRRLARGDVQDFLSGEARVASYGTANEPVSFAVVRRAGSGSLGFQVPDLTAVVDETTFPVAGVIGETGRVYPVILGYPGHTDTAADDDAYAVVPVPFAQFALGTSDPMVMVSEDGAQPITSVVLRNDTTLLEAVEDVVAYTDLRGRTTRMADFTASALPFTPTVDGAKLMFAGFFPDGGGGPRALYDVIRYLLHRWGGDSVDWARLPAVRDALAPYAVDTWIDSPLASPWDWIEPVLASLPFEVRTSAVGRYIVQRRWVSDPRRNVGTITEGVDAARVGGVSFTVDGPYNEFTMRCAVGRDGDPLVSVVLTGRDGVESARRYGSTVTNTQRDGRCTRSVARYGPRQAPPVDLWWTWSEATALRAARDAADLAALPARLVTYLVEDAAGVMEGDELTLNDPDRGFDGVAAIVDAPPVVGSAATTLSFRVPE